MKTSGKEALLQILKAEGIEYVFGIPGATEVQIMDALEDHPEIKYILCLHETSAVGMAEGYFRASGKPACLNLHTATGLAASLPLMSNAFYGNVPLIVTVGQQDTRLWAAEPAMSGDLLKIGAPFVKWGTEIIHAEDIPLIMRRAFKLAFHPPQGPVMVSLPLDVMADTFEFSYDPGTRVPSRLHPDGDSLKLAADILAGAHNPAIIVEDGITRCSALAEIVRLAEQTGSRVYQSWMSDVNFPVRHPQYLGDLDLSSPQTAGLLAEVDVLVAAGARLFQQPVYFHGPLLSSSTRLIQIDDNPWEIGKNYPTACALEGDISASLAGLSAALEPLISGRAREEVLTRIETISAEKAAAETVFAEKMRRERDNIPIAATRLMQEIRDALKPGTHIVDDCWSYSSILRRIMPLDELRAYQRSRSGGSIGGGLPAAIGAKLALPERPVVCISGDGSALWSIQSLWVSARYNIPVKFIILSNGAYRQVRIMKTRIMGDGARGRDLGTELYPPRNDFCQIAGGMGLRAFRVEKPGDLRGVLKEALESSGPCLVDVTVDASF